MTITCGIDWAENHHDVALVDGSGKLVAKRRISDDAEGYRRLLELLVEAGAVHQRYVVVVLRPTASSPSSWVPRPPADQLLAPRATGPTST